MTLLRKSLAVLVSYFMVACLMPLDVAAQDAQQQQAAQSSAQQAPASADQNANVPPEDDYAPLTAEELDGVVAPIALYPDALVAQVLGAASFPDQVTDAAFWIRDNSSLTGDALAKAVDGQDWDPSVKALTQFPTVLDQLARNLAWTSTLGEAAAMQQADVMAAVQRLRAKAKDSGNLKTSSEIKVVQESPQTIVIQPANPQVIYVPQYNPTVVYGAPVVVPDYTYVQPSGVAIAAGISFGAGIAIGAAFSNGCGGWGWGWGCWGMGWGPNTIIYNRNVYYGNPYWRGGYYRPYRPGYPSYGRPPYYRPPNRPGRPVGGRPPYNRPPHRPPNGGRPPYNPGKPNPGRPIGGKPPQPGRPGGGKPPTIQPVPNPGRPGGGQPGRPGNGGGQPGRPGGQPGGPGGQPGKPGGQPGGTRPSQPSIQPVPNPGTRPSPGVRPAPVTTRPSTQPNRGYTQPAPKPATIKPAPAKSGTFSSGGRPAATRGNQSMGSSRGSSNRGGKP